MDEPVQTVLLGEASERADLAMLVWNAERRYVAANDKACELLGVTRDELLAAPVGATNRSPEAQAAIAGVLARVPARGRITVRGVDLEWLVVPTALAGLEHVLGLFWPVFA